MTYYKLDSFVNDFSWVLENKKEFNKNFYEYEQESWVQIATIFINHRKWRALKDIALEIFNKNWIWKKQTNSWLLLVVVTDEKKIRIMTGKWMEIEFPDSLARDIIQNELRWLLNSWKYEQLLKSWYELSTKKRKVKGSFYSYKTKTSNIDSSNNTNSNNDIFWKFITIIFGWIFWGAFFNIIWWLSFFNGFLIFWLVAMFFSLFFWRIKNKSMQKAIMLFIFVLILIYALFVFWKKIDVNNYSWNSSSYNSSWGSSSSSSWSNSSYDSTPSYNSSWGGWSSNWGGFGD